MTGFFEFFTSNYPQFVSLSTTALVCWFVYKFYLKAEGFSKEWTDFKTKYFPKIEERLAKVDKIEYQLANFIEQMNERAAKTDEQFAKADERAENLIKEMNERSAKSDERFAKFGEKMDERAAKADERVENLTKEMN